MSKNEVLDPVKAQKRVQFSCKYHQCEVRGMADSELGPIILLAQFQDLVDPNVGQLPIQTYSQQRGIRAAEIAALALSKIAFVHRVETGTDIGIDFICELRADYRPTSQLFNVQCKALPVSFDQIDTDVDFTIKVSTARYWLEQAHTTILLVPDPDTGDVYWSAPVAELRSRRDEWRNQGTVQISVLKSSKFNCFGPVPDVLAQLSAEGIGSVGNAFQERLFTKIQAIRAERAVGVNRASKNLAPELMSSASALKEAGMALNSLLSMHNDIAELLRPILLDYCGVLWKRAEDVYRIQSALDGVGIDWEQHPDYQAAREALTAAGKLVDRLDSEPAGLLMGELLSTLDDLETWHFVTLDVERINEAKKLKNELAYNHSIGEL